jgi:ABC-type sugar transport system permease subunit
MERGLTVQPRTSGARLARGRRGWLRRVWAHRWSYVYVAPMLLLFGLFTIYPIFASLGYTLYDWNGIGNPVRYVGLDNFRQVVHSWIFWTAFLHTVVYAAVLVPIQLTLALALALVLNNPRLRFSTFYRTVYFLPTVTSAAIVGVVFQLIIPNLGDRVDAVLFRVGLLRQHIDFLADPRAVLWIVIGIGIWHTLGYNLVYFLAGLQTIPRELYEAARIDGAHALGRFLHVTMPMLRAVGVVILFLAILGSLQVFDLVQALTGGGPFYASEVVNTYIYHQAFGSTNQSAPPNVGFASAASFFYGTVLLLLTSLQAVALAWFRRRRRQDGMR